MAKSKNYNRTKYGALTLHMAAAIRDGFQAGLEGSEMKSLMGFTGQRPGLFELPPIPVTELTGKEFGEGLSRREPALAADAKLRRIQRIAGLPNTDTGWVLRVNRKGRAKMGDNADMTAAESKAVRHRGVGSGCRGG